MTDAEIIAGLRDLCGYVENGSDTSIQISQDDATKDWVIHIGRSGFPNGNWTWGYSFREACEKAITEFGKDYLR
jgi:hypothetical protein